MAQVVFQSIDQPFENDVDVVVILVIFFFLRLQSEAKNKMNFSSTEKK